MFEYILVYGLVTGMSILLLTIGFSLTFGISGIANFAYGGFYLLSGCLAWFFLRRMPISLPLAVPLTLFLIGLFGFYFYRLLLSRVRGMPLAEVVATYSLGVAILEFLRWIGVVTYEFSLPWWAKGTIFIGGCPLDLQRLVIVMSAIGITVFYYWFSHYTRIGLGFRALAQEERTAMTLGIDSETFAALSVAMGCMFAGFAATILLPLGIISINVGYDALLIALAAAIVGGLESVGGVILASLALGYAQTIVSFVLKPEWGMVVYLGAIFLILILKPSGLLGKFKELEERV